MAVRMQEGNMPHIYWIDLNNDGVYTECAVMKRDNLGNVFFFPLKSLDNIDKKRLARILSNRNAVHFELWDLMSNITLNNGVNALTYFHQLVEMVTPSGRVMKPQEGTIGVEQTVGVIDTRNPNNRSQHEKSAQEAAELAARVAAQAAQEAYRSYNTGQPSQQPAQQQAAPAPAPAKKSTSSQRSSGSTKKS